MSRDILIHRLHDVLFRDSRVRGAWLSGSLGRGTADAYSDVDIWIAVDKTQRDRFIEDWPTVADTIAPVVFNERVGTLPIFNVITNTWLRYDLAIGTVDDAATRIHSTMSQLFDKDGLEAQFRVSGELLTPDPVAISKLIKEFFRVLGLLPVVIGREEYVLAISGAGLLRTLVIQLMLEDVKVVDRGGVLHVKQLLPPDRYTALSSLPPMVANRESAIAVHLACAQLFLPLAHELSDQIGLDWPNALDTACREHLARELDVVLPDFTMRG